MPSVDLNQIELHYKKTGKGNIALLAFHGFGQHSSAFDGLGKIFGDEMTIYSFDLFFHGRSKWDMDKKYITKTIWETLISRLIEEEGIHDMVLMGYSIGAKFTLATLELFPDQVKQVILVAPDGIKLAFWYRLSTGSSLIRQYFYSLIFNPSSFFTILRLIDFFRLIPTSVSKMVKYQMASRTKRYRLYFTWVTSAKLKPDLSAMSHQINDNNIQVTLFLSEKDDLVPTRQLLSFIKKLKLVQVIKLRVSHFNLVKETIHCLSNNRDVIKFRQEK